MVGGDWCVWGDGDVDFRGGLCGGVGVVEWGEVVGGIENGGKGKGGRDVRGD